MVKQIISLALLLVLVYQCKPTSLVTPEKKLSMDDMVKVSALYLKHLYYWENHPAMLRPDTIQKKIDSLFKSQGISKKIFQENINHLQQSEDDYSKFIDLTIQQCKSVNP
jgi:hypothetical protein